MAGGCRALAPDRRSRLALVVSRRYSLEAVTRNRARRLLRESFRLLQAGFGAPHWLVLVARPSLAGACLQAVQAEMLAQLAKAGVMEWPRT